MIPNVTNIKINNVPITYPGQVIRITNGRPVVTWVFSSNEVAVVTAGAIASQTPSVQYSYEVRLGTSSTNQGTNSFTGNLAATGTTVSPTMYWRYFGTLLTRGTTYYGQVRVTDAFSNTSAWQSFTILYNTLPVVSGITFNTSTPIPGQSISITYTYTDADGDAERGTKIRWFRNGIYERQFDNYLVLPAGYTQNGDSLSVDVEPNDGFEFGGKVYSGTVNVSAPLDTNPFTNVMIIPNPATTNDPLYAQFIYNGTNTPTIQWYYTPFGGGEAPAHQADNLRLFRFATNPGDSLRFTVCVGAGTIYSSPSVVIQTPPFRIFNFKLDGESEALQLATLTPKLTWEAVGPSGAQATFALVTIGTSPDANNILNVIVPISDNSYVIPSGLLSYGLDYYASVAISTSNVVSTVGQATPLHFRTQGSLWQTGVNNTAGWTVEAVVQVVSDYQGIRIADGAKYVEIQLYTNKIVSASATTLSANVTLNDAMHTITVVGVQNSIKVYVDYQLLIDGSPHSPLPGSLNQATSLRSLEFGAIGSAGEALWSAFRYAVSGPHYPVADPAFSSMSFEPVVSLPLSSVTGLTELNGGVLAAVQTPDNTTDFYLYDGRKDNLFTPTVSRTYSPVNRIEASPNGQYHYFCHANGATYFKSHPIVKYDNSVDMTLALPTTIGWEQTLSNAYTPTVSISNGLVIDTTGVGGGKWFYTMTRKGSDWFDNVDNEKGWTVDFTVKVDSVIAGAASAYTGSAEGTGLYVSDGTFYETVQFFANQIVFVNANVVAEVGATSAYDYRLIGQNNRIQLFSRFTGSTNPFSPVLDGQLSFFATKEANGNRPAALADFGGFTHVVWHDDGNPDGRVIYYSYFDNVEWSTPIIIVPADRNAKNPCIAIDQNSNLYVFYESNTDQNISIGMVIHNQFGWSEPTTVIDTGANALVPKAVVDGNNTLHLVWEDYTSGIPCIQHISRDGTSGVWSSKFQLSGATDLATNPAIDADTGGSVVAVTWTVRATTGRSNIFGRSINTSLSFNWGNTSQFSTNGYDADHSDLCVANSEIVVVWHDNQYSGSPANYNVYVQVADYTMALTGSTYTLSDNSYNAKFPTIAWANGATPKHFMCWENADAASIVTLSHKSSVSAWTIDGSNTCRSSITFSVARSARRPTMPRSVSGSVSQVLYEADITDQVDDLFMQNGTTYTYIRNMAITLPTSNSSYNVTTTGDVVVSGQLPRKSIRFGSFSDSLSSAMRWHRISMYLSEAVQPFEVGLISSSTQVMQDDRAYDALVNDNGDAWLGTQGGLNFYFMGNGTVASFYKANEGHSSSSEDQFQIRNKPAQKIITDDNGVLYVSSGASIYSSSDHVTFNEMTISAMPGGVTAIRDMLVTSDGEMVLATDAGLFFFTAGFGALSESFTNTSGLPSNNVTCVALDGEAVWVGTDAGLVRVLNGQCVLYNTTNSSILSNQVNGIAVRSPVHRYIATAGGLSEMKGNAFSLLSTSSPNQVWNNNVRAVSFASPNTLWVSNLSNIAQIQLDDDTGIHSSVVYDINNYTLNATAYDDLRTFYAVGAPSVDPKALVEVYVNGGRIPGGYTLSQDLTIVQFDAPLLYSDIVHLNYRNDFTTYATLRQNLTEIEAVGKDVSLVDRIASVGTGVYAHVVENGTPLLYKYDTTSDLKLPYDRIFLDQTPPTGTLSILEQLSNLQVKVQVNNPVDTGSGISQMIISNWKNFTTDGSTPQAPVPFSTTAVQTLSNTATGGNLSLTFASGTGTVFGYFSTTLFGGTKVPAQVFRLQGDGTWVNTVNINGVAKTSFDDLGSVDCLTQFGSQFYAAVGRDGGTSTKVYSSNDGINWSIVGSIGAAHATSNLVFNNFLYLGGSNGNIYQFDGATFYPPLATGLLSCDSITAYLNNLYVGGAATTGGQIVSINTMTQTPQIIFTTTDPTVSALNFFSVGSQNLIYAGVSASGKIYRRDVTGGVFAVTFSDVPAKVSTIRQGIRAISASIGSTVYQQSITTAGVIQSWDVAALFPESAVNDFFFLPTTTTVNSTTTTTYPLWAMTPTGIYTVPPATSNVNVYLRLIDAAGNVSADPNFASISIANLTGYVYADQILQLNSTTGVPVNRYTGAAPFYSAQRVQAETGEYWSDIFYGTNNLIAWDQMSWNGVAPTGTDIKLYVRAANTEEAVLSAAWSVPFENNLQSGVNISFVQGVYIQFRAVLSTTVANLSPSLSQVVLRSKCSQSTHFYTTNFMLGSSVVRGLLTANTIIPVSADIQWGFSTTNATDFDAYQIISPDQVFTADSDQTGSGIRVGIKFVSPTPPVLVTDVFGTTGPGSSPLFINNVNETYSISTSGNYSFAVTFYNSATMIPANIVFTADSTVDYTGFVVNGTNMTGGTISLPMGTATMTYTPPGTVNLVCSPQANPTYYYTQITVKLNTVLQSGLTEAAHSFVIPCNPTFYDNISFTFTPSSSKVYAFRVLMYDNADRTDTPLLTYYTGVPWPLGSTGTWKINGGAYTNSVIPVTGDALVSSTPYTVTLHPPEEDLVQDQTYYLTIQAYGTGDASFTPISNSLTFKGSDPVSDVACGSYTNVPIVKGFAITFTLADGSLATVNV